jgi:hypothetical protein
MEERRGTKERDTSPAANCGRHLKVESLKGAKVRDGSANQICICPGEDSAAVMKEDAEGPNTEDSPKYVVE